MATLASNAATLLDWAKRIDPSTNSVETAIAELLTEENAILDDMLWKQGNLPTGHRITVRTGLPSVTWRKLNAGIPSSKSTTAQVDEACGMLEAIGEVDKALADLADNAKQFRLSENSAFIEAMRQEMAQTLFYGDHTTAPEEFLGLAPRFSTISGATNGQNIIDGAGSGADNTSIWLVGWGDETVYGIFPKGSKAGLSHKPTMDGTGDGAQWATDSNGNPYRAYVDHYKWDAGMALKDWRAVVRIANIDVSNLIAESSAADLIKLLSRAIDRLPEKKMKPVFYANRTIFSMLRIQALNKSNAALSINDALDQFGKSRKQLEFQGIPVRKVDQLLSTEAQIT